MLGTVKWFDPVKGYGFIVPHGGGKDVFVHIKTVQEAGLRMIAEGRMVAFEAQERNGKLVAVNLRA
jgi:cold shock protein